VAFAVAAAVAVAAGAAGAAPLRGSWSRCATGAGGALNVSVERISCRYAQLVTEDGLYPGGRRTRVGSFGCDRHRDVHGLLVYRCLREHRPAALSFDTY
jgi:hypothetical protein